jgi:hypothetical protein
MDWTSRSRSPDANVRGAYDERRRMKCASFLVAFLAVVLAFACAPARTPAPTPAPSRAPAPALTPAPAPADDRVVPGDAYVEFGERIDLGFAKLRLRAVEPCGDRTTTAVLEVDHPPKMLDRQWPAELLDEAGVRLASAKSTSFGCAGDSDRDAQRMYFDASLGASWLALDIEEPHGLAHYRVHFALRRGLSSRAPARRASPRPAPPSARIGDPVETPYYRVTPLRVLYCGYTMYAMDLWSVEIAVENFSNVPIAFPATAKLVDEQGRKYDQRYGERAPCVPVLENADVAPGGSARGFVQPIQVPRGIKSVDLVYAPSSRSMWSPPDEHTIHLGALPTDALAGHWDPPSTRDVSAPGFRVTVTSLRRCTLGESGKDYVGVEILVENDSAKDEFLGNPAATLEDGSHYRYEHALNGALTECTPSVENPFRLRPGQKVRGWLYLFNVAASSGPWTLHYSLRQSGAGEIPVDLPVGKLSFPK